MKNKIELFTGLFLLLSIALVAQPLQTKTYLPDYRGKQLFGVGSDKKIPYRSTRPFTDKIQLKESFPKGYRQSQGIYWLSEFDEVIFFTLRITKEGHLDIEKRDQEILAYLQRLKILYSKKITLALAGHSDLFISLIQNKAQKTQALSQIKTLITEYKLDGIDLDWEFPRNKEEKDLHLAFLKDLRALCDSENIKLSMAISSARPLHPEAYKICDTLNLMAYDFYGRHSTLESTKEALEYTLLRNEIPSDKIILGLPFYGRIFDGNSPDYWKKTKSYRDIYQEFTPLANQNEVGGFYFNNKKILQEKKDLAESHKIKGLFIWEIGQDNPSQPLSQILFED